MNVVIHCGAHRTAGAGFQDYMRRHADVLRAQGIDFCGPEETRRGLFAGISPCATAQRAKILSAATAGRIALRLQRARSRGAGTLLVSDVDLLGGLRESAGQGLLYPEAGARLARYARAFPEDVRQVVISIRSLESFWVSALAQAVARGAPVLDRSALRGIGFAERSWRDVITELAEALPRTRVSVLPYENFRGRPERFASCALACDPPLDRDRSWLNRAPHLPELRRKLAERGAAPDILPFGMGHWNPFCTEELAALRERYADDMMWLTGGADGLATLTEDRPEERAGKSLPFGSQTKGHCNVIEERHLAHPG